MSYIRYHYFTASFHPAINLFIQYSINPFRS